MSVTWGKKLAISAALLMSSAFAQSVQPFVAGGLELLGSGYQTLGTSAVAGVFVDTPHVFVNPEAGYTTGGKEEENVNSASTVGHTRMLRSDVFARFGKYFIGPGVSWSKLYTPEFSKSSVHPRFGVGRDFTSGYVDRVFVSYVGAGTDRANAVQGLDMQGLWFFGTRHIFLRMDLGAYWAHGTVIPVNRGGSPQSIAAELATHIATADLQTVFGWRW